MSNFPYMQFDVYNPLDNAIKTAMGVYEGIGQGKTRSKEMEQISAQTKKIQAETAKNEMLLGLIAQTFGLQPGSMGGQQNTQGQQMQSAGAQFMPVGGGIGQFSASGLPSGNEVSGLMMREFLGLPIETPNEKLGRDMYAHSQNKMFDKGLEQTMGTSANIAKNKNLIMGVNNTLPVIDQLSTMDIPNQVAGGKQSPDKQAKYMGLANSAVESLIAGLGLTASEATIDLAKQQLQRQSWETEGGYKERLKGVKKHLLENKGRAEMELGMRPSQQPQQQAPQQQGSSSGKVRVQAPDGTIRMIPEQFLDDAIKAGGKRV